MAACMFRPLDIAPCQRQVLAVTRRQPSPLHLAPRFKRSPPQQPPENEPQRRACFDST